MKNRIAALLLALCLAVGILPGTASAAGAASGIQYGNTENTWQGHRYQVFNNRATWATWEEAERYCESLGGHLATISCKEENDFIYQVMIAAGYTSAYFGFTDRDLEKTWTWVNGETVTYTNWHSGEPNSENVNEDYAMFYFKYRDGTWNDGDFGRRTASGGTAFICEWDAYTVTFNANGGTTATKSRSVTNGSTYGALPTPTRTGYKFDGWYTAKTSGTKVTSTTKANLTANQTLYAHWTKNATTAKTMTVTFNANGGTTPTKSKSVTNGSTYGALPAPTRTGYKFDGWYTSSTGGTKVTSATKVTKTAAHTLYAHWSKTQAQSRTFRLDFDANGGEVLTEYRSVITGTRYRSLPTPVLDRYHFNGWYTEADGGRKITVSSKVSNTVTTLYAQWTKNNPTAKTKSGSYKIVIPEDYKVFLYGNETTSTVAKTAAAQSGDYTVTCTKMATLSNGTVRYYGKFTKVSNTTSYWFTYTDEMFIN